MFFLFSVIGGTMYTFSRVSHIACYTRKIQRVNHFICLLLSPTLNFFSFSFSNSASRIQKNGWSSSHAGFSRFLERMFDSSKERYLLFLLHSMCYLLFVDLKHVAAILVGYGRIYVAKLKDDCGGWIRQILSSEKWRSFLYWPNAHLTCFHSTTPRNGL